MPMCMILGQLFQVSLRAVTISPSGKITKPHRLKDRDLLVKSSSFLLQRVSVLKRVVLAREGVADQAALLALCPATTKKKKSGTF